MLNIATTCLAGKPEDDIEQELATVEAVFRYALKSKNRAAAYLWAINFFPARMFSKSNPKLVEPWLTHVFPIFQLRAESFAPTST